MTDDKKIVEVTDETFRDIDAEIISESETVTQEPAILEAVIENVGVPIKPTAYEGVTPSTAEIVHQAPLPVGTTETIEAEKPSRTGPIEEAAKAIASTAKRISETLLEDFEFGGHSFHSPKSNPLYKKRSSSKSR